MTHPLFQAQAFTANGALTLATSGNACLDFFQIAAASRGKDITRVFAYAYQENREVALRTLLWLRDIRGGAGERQTFRDLYAMLNEEDQLALLGKVPEVGRWDDLLAHVDNEDIARFCAYAAVVADDGLAAKWMPRQGPIASKLRKIVEMTPKEWRKALVANSNTVEQQMSARNWDEINFSHVPSVAASRYQKAFNRQATERYSAYRSALVKGEAKINAGAIFPHSIVEKLFTSHTFVEVQEAQWKALPNYLEGNDELILPVVDVSGSMQSYGVLQHAVALGVYLAERNGSVFKDHIISFSGHPNFHDISASTLAEKVQKVRRSGEDMSTNLQGVFDALLSRANRYRIAPEDMPTKLLVLSDMEFNSPGVGRTNFEAIQAKFATFGYKMPQLVFWNLNGRPGNSPVTHNQEGVAMVSGFSPAIMKTLLGGKTFTPVDVMLDTVMVDRYKFQ